jgi:DNA-directed RNA polymerase specialized sigma24 family protein
MAPWSLRERLSEDMIQAMVCAYCTGTTARELAVAHDLSLSSVKRLLRTAGVRRMPPPQRSTKAIPAVTEL